MKINNVKFVPATGKIDNQFVGIKILNNEIEFHYPETYYLSENESELRKDIISILRTISLAKTISSDVSSYNSKANNSYVFPLKSFLWILNDYLTFGRYINREKIYERGVKGRINWKKTMHSNPAISDGNIIYTEIISEHKNQKDNLLTEIYFYCIQKTIDSIGWLYNIKFDNQGKDYYKLFNQKKYLNAINDEINHTFDDVKRIRLSNMKNIILGLDESMKASKDMIYGVDSYDYVYEKMIDLMFSRVSNKKEFYPNATWDLLLEDEPQKSTNLRPDTVLIDSNKVYILDAKYYRYGTTFIPRDLPETTSIQKQITYGEYVKKVKAGQYEDVFSAFIMPYNRYSNLNNKRLNKNIEFIGIANAKWIGSNTHNRKIIGILIDAKYLINNWIKKCEQDTDDLIKMIEEYVDYINEKNNVSV